MADRRAVLKGIGASAIVPLLPAPAVDADAERRGAEWARWLPVCFAAQADYAARKAPERLHPTPTCAAAARGSVRFIARRIAVARRRQRRGAKR
jgi:hypothetical protein